MRYEQAPRTIAALDTLLVQLASESSKEPEVVQRIAPLFWSSGHPLGAFMAGTIIATFGPDSIFPGTRSPAAFLRTYASAQHVRGQPEPFSRASWRLIDSLENRYWK